MDFKEFFFKTETKTICHLNDSNSPFNNLFKESSLHSQELNLPTRSERGRVIVKIIDRPKMRLTFRDGGFIELDRQGWFEKVKGKNNIYDIKPGDRADVEYYAHQNNKTGGPMQLLSVYIY